MTTDFRALCAELADELTQFNAWYIEDNGYGLPALEALLRRSDAALAQSDEPAVPEGREPASVISEPSDEELRDIWDSGHLPSNEELANDDGEQDLQFLFTSAYYQWLEENPDAMAEHKTKCIRAVFNAGRRWGNPAPQPVPISERLPGDQLCWWYEPDEDDDGIGYGGKWTLLRIRGAVSYYTHWLPAHAIPIPTAND